MAPKKTCKDCGGGSRPAPYPGPRCATHHRDRKRATREAAHGRWILKTYGITKEQYEALREAQNGFCFLCQRARGVTKKLAVDHDHQTGYVRGLLCGPCNSLLAHLRDDVDFAHRIVNYLYDPPAFNIIGKVKPNGQA